MKKTLIGFERFLHAYTRTIIISAAVPKRIFKISITGGLVVVVVVGFL